MMATVTAHLNDVAAMIGLFGWGLYFRTLSSGHVRTMPMNWLATAIIAFTAAVTTAELSSIAHAALYLVNTVCALTVVARSLRNLEKIRWPDALLIGLGLLMFACALRRPQDAAVLVSAYYLVNYASMGLRVLRGRGVEHPAGWFAWACGASVLAVALRGHGGYSELVPLTNIIVWSWMGGIASYLRWLGTRATPLQPPEATITAARSVDEIRSANPARGATGPDQRLEQCPSVSEFRLDGARRMPPGHCELRLPPTMTSSKPRTMNINYETLAGLVLAAASSAAAADTTTITLPFNTLLSSVGHAIQRVVAPASAGSAPAPRTASAVSSAALAPARAQAAVAVHSAKDALRRLTTAAADAPAAIRTCMRDAVANGNLDAASFQRSPDGGYIAHWDGAMVMLGLLAYYGVSPNGQVEIAADCTSTGPSIPRIGDGKVLTYFTTRAGGHPSAALREWVLAPNNAPIEPRTVAVHAPGEHRTVAMATFLRGG
jgi:hypothetical protein